MVEGSEGTRVVLATTREALAVALETALVGGSATLHLKRMRSGASTSSPLSPLSLATAAAAL